MWREQSGKRGGTLRFALLLVLAGCCHASPLNADDLVHRSVVNNDANWKVAPEYAYTEHDVITKGGHRTVRTYEVTMIEGSPYNKLIAIDNKPLSLAERTHEEEKLQSEISHRRAEGPSAKRKRVAEYERERRQDHELMSEMINAFKFTLAGEETMNGRRCFRVDASPRPGYVPRSRDTKVLTGMRGTLWIDASEYQWVRVTASVFRPVAFGLFIAHVQPGTEFTLDEAPVDGNVWMPMHFRTRVNATVLFWSHNSDDDETYSNYYRIGGERLGSRSARRGEQQIAAQR